MKLRQAAKILKRIYACNIAYKYDDVPLPKSWRHYMCLWHKANAVVNRQSPFGRMANQWLNQHSAKIAKKSKLNPDNYENIHS